MANPLTPIWSNLANRKDKASQRYWTEYRQYGYVTGGTPLQANGYVVLGPDGKIDPSLLPSSGSTVRVNGTPITNPNFNNTTPAAPSGFTNVIWQFDGSGNVSAAYQTTGVTASFADITSGTNMTAAMVVGSGASITVACPGSGVIEATELATDNCTPVATNISHPTHPGMLLISQPGNASAAWMDPQVQGLYAAGSTICPAPAYVAPTCIQPVLIGGEDPNGLLQNISTTSQGEIIVAPAIVSTIQSTATLKPFAWDTGANPLPLTSGQLVPLISITPQNGTVKFLLAGADVNTMSAIAQFQLIRNGTLTGASFVNVPNSNMKYDVSATSVSGGTRVDSGFTTVGTRTLVYSIPFSNGDIWTLAAQRQTGTGNQFGQAAVRWIEASGI